MNYLLVGPLIDGCPSAIGFEPSKTLLRAVSLAYDPKVPAEWRVPGIFYSFQEGGAG